MCCQPARVRGGWQHINLYAVNRTIFIDIGVNVHALKPIQLPDSIMQPLKKQTRVKIRRCNAVACFVMLLIFAGFSDPPELSLDEHGDGVLHIGKRTCSIICVAPDAKLLRSWRWYPDFPDLYVFEVNQGTAMSMGASESHSLVVVNTASRESKVLCDKPIYEATSRFDPEIGKNFTSKIEMPYRLAKGRAG